MGGQINTVLKIDSLNTLYGTNTKGQRDGLVLLISLVSDGQL